MSSFAQNAFEDFPRVDIDRLSSSYLVVSQISGDGAQSFKICALDLAAQLFLEHSTRFGIKSMAYEDAGNYAKISHDHDIYTSACAEPNFSIVDQVPVLALHDLTHGQQFSLSIAHHISTDNDLLKDTVLKIYQLQPRIGEMRMQSTSDFNGIDQPSFDGWIPLDGASYFLSDFYDALDLSTVFLADEDGSFSIPNVQSFMKLDTSLDSSISTKIEGKTCLASHTHQIVQDINSQLKDSRLCCSIVNDSSAINVGVRSSGSLQGTNKIQMSPYGSGSQGSGNHAHYGTGNVRPWQTHCVAKIDKNAFVNSGLKTLPALKANASKQESYPSYTSLSAFVYVGRSISSANLHDPMPYFSMRFNPNGGHFEDGSISTLVVDMKAGDTFDPPKVYSDAQKFDYWKQTSPIDASSSITLRKVPIGDMEFTAQWGDPLFYEVKFYDYDFSDGQYVLCDTQTVKYGDPAVPPFNQLEGAGGHVFNGWFPTSYQHVTRNLDVYAQYDATSQLVTEDHNYSIVAQDGVGFSLGR